MKPVYYVAEGGIIIEKFPTKEDLKEAYDFSPESFWYA